jgi:hypothetical protein
MALVRRFAAALALILAAACAGVPAAHTPQTRAESGKPEPDPACHGNLAQCLEDTGLERVIVKVGVSREGKIAFLDVLTPDLTSSDYLELRRALEGCLWKPAVGADGERVEGTLTLAIQR